MEISFVKNDEDKEKEGEGKNKKETVEEIKFSQPSEIEEKKPSSQNKDKHPSFLGKFFNYFRKNNKEKTSQKSSKNLKSSLIREGERSKEHNKDSDQAPPHPRHNKNFYKTVEKIEKQEERNAKKNPISDIKTTRGDRNSSKIIEIDNPEFLKTNLIKIEEDLEPDWGRNMAFLLISVILALAVLGFSYWGLLFWGNKKIKESATASEDVQKSVEEVKNKRLEAADAIEFRDRVGLVNSMLDGHVYWTNFFEFLEKNTLEEVYYSDGFKGTTEGEYVLTANTKKYSLIQAQVEQFKKSPYVIEAGVEKAELAVDQEAGLATIKFDLRLNIQPSLFTEMEN